MQLPAQVGACSGYKMYATRQRAVQCGNVCGAATKATNRIARLHSPHLDQHANKLAKLACIMGSADRTRTLLSLQKMKESAG